MATPKIYACDLAHKRYSSITATPTDASLSEQNLVDGDPNSLFEPGDTLTSVRIVLPSKLMIRGYGLANHNLLGGVISLRGIYDSTMYEFDTYRPVTTCEDFVVDLGVQPAADEIDLLVESPTDDIQIGCISILADYGYNAAGELVEGEGFGILEFGGDDAGGMPRPLPVGGDSGVRVLTSANGWPQFQRLGSPVESFVLPFELMRAARDYELWRLWNAYYPRRRGVYSNPGFSRGVWYTADDWALETPEARYCVGRPDQQPRYQIDHAGSRSSGSLFLQTLPRDSVA